MEGINVIVPMGGLGSRFQKEGYLTRPKPFVPVLGKPMILWVLDSLSLGQNDKLIIVFNPDFMNIGRFMREVVGTVFPKCQFVALPGPTRGAAETVLFGLQALTEESRKRPTMLVDGDTFYIADVVGMFRQVASTHNAVVCFHDAQPKPMYSYVTMDSQDNLLEVREKVKISDWANSGCYCFRDGCQLATECAALIEANSRQNSQDGVGEFYTSGVIAAMLSRKEAFKALKIGANDFHVLGTPSQVAEFCSSWPAQPKQRFVFDLEGVLISSFQGGPIERNIQVCRRLKEQGHIIIIHSTRVWGMKHLTWQMLEDLKIPCDDLVLGKPTGDFYVGGPTTIDGLLSDLDKQIGFHPTPIQASIHHRIPPAKKPKLSKVGSLTPHCNGVTCLLQVLDEFRKVERDEGGGPQVLWEVTCGDETGRIIMSLTELQTAGLKKEHVFMVQNGFLKMVGGFLRLVVDRWGRLDLSPGGDVSMGQIGDLNLSSIEHELTEVKADHPSSAPVKADCSSSAANGAQGDPPASTTDHCSN